MNASAGTGVFLLSLMSIPISNVFNFLIYNNSIETVFFAGCATVLTLAISMRFLIKKVPDDPLFYVFAMKAFLSVLNLMIGLEQDCIIDGFMTFYLKQADPHINTAHGHMVSYWNGCLHYLMYLVMVAAISWADNYRAIGLYWVGSFLMCVIVYILGNAVGKYWTHVGPLFLFHILYVLVSVWACLRIITQGSTRDVTVMDTQRKSLVHRPLDLLFIMYLIAALAFCVFRGMIVLDCSSELCQEYTQKYEPYLRDPSAYPKIQMLVSMLYSGPYYILSLYGLLVPGCEWMPELTLVHSGAVAQAQFCYIGASLHTRTPFPYRVPSDSQAVFLLVNVLYALVPQALCHRCATKPAFFLRATPDEKSK